MRRVILGILALLGAAVASAAAFPAERAFEHLRAQCDLGPRNPGSEGHRRCADYIRSTLEAAGGRVTLQTFSHVLPENGQNLELVNILARFGPRRSGGILLGAHWDTRPWADQDPDPAAHRRPILGANDGASGTGVLLALAESFADDPPSVPVLLVFFDGEDLGRPGKHEEWCIGSRYFANHFPAPIPDVGMVIDMVASKSMILTVELKSREFFPDQAALVEQLAAEEGLLHFQPGAGPSVMDDHVPLIEAGLPTLLLIDFRDPVWHTLQDIPAHCRTSSLAEAGRLVERWVRGGYFR